MTTQGSGQGSEPEQLVFRELLRRGLVPGLDFEAQAAFGLANTKGSNVPDFLFFNPPGLAVNVQGVWIHYGQGSDKIAADRLLRARLAGEGITLIFLDADDVAESVRYYVGEALQFRDHSRLG